MLSPVSPSSKSLNIGVIVGTPDKLAVVIGKIKWGKEY